MPDEESRRRDDSFISSGSGWLHLPKTVCGQPKERVNHCDSQCIRVRCFQGSKIFITEGSHSNITGYDAKESNPLWGGCC